MFGNVLGLNIQETSELLRKEPWYNKRVKRLKKSLKKSQWPRDAKEHVSRFLEGFSILNENRNLVMHSSIFAEEIEKTILYKQDRDLNKTTIIEVSVNDLRRVADDMKKYTYYGLCMMRAILLLGERDLLSELENPLLPSPLEYA